jgi:heavy metal translocating P-type ATPase
MRTFGRFIKRYIQFSFVVIATLIGLGLYFADLKLGARIVVSAAALIVCVPLLNSMWHDLRSGTYGIDILAITGIVTAVILGEYWAAVVIGIMLTGGEALEDYAEHRAKSELTALLHRTPQKATILRGRKTIEVPAREVKVGDKLLLKPGEVVPVDAIILEGSGSFDESALTGESLPVLKQVGDTILSGSSNVDGAITVRCIHSAKDSQFEQIIKLVRAASNSKAPFIRLADKYAVPFTIISYTIAGCTWIYTGDPVRFLEVIVVATPCPLILAAPIAIISGMSRSAKAGIIVKHGGALETLAQAKTIAFDKTGTLTLGLLKVDTVQTYNRHTIDSVLAAAASLEQHSNHVVALAILNEAKERSVRLAKVKNLRESAGLGLQASYNGKEVLVGRLSYLQDHTIDIKAAGKTKQTATYVAINGELAGAINFTDTVRPESAATIEALGSQGYRTIHMITGDNLANARSVAAEVGIDKDNITASALPADKLHALEAFTNKPVAFVGDGVNDAPVLTSSDVGIALGARGSTVASESADIVILQDDISRVAVASAIAKRTFKIATQSILIGIFISIGLMGVYATGRFSALSGAIVQELVDVIVIFNALRAHGSFKQ